MSANSTLIAAISLIFVAGCGDTVEPQANPRVVESSPKVPSGQVADSYTVQDLTERDAEIIRFVLAQHDRLVADRIYFLTSTPMTDWGETGNWKDLPQSFHDSIAALIGKYRVAHEAYLRDGRRVLEKGTDAKAWMRWITIKRWISDTEVEVEDGVFCCPLGGGAVTATYEKVDGKWRFKSSGPGWVS